ncbi:MAG: hypothetical protein JRD89_03675 [Deltaproteobacteria bacterium]|nr:hypothetical protein [Deltaproteobacteria bacterium]
MGTATKTKSKKQSVKTKKSALKGPASVIREAFNSLDGTKGEIRSGAVARNGGDVYTRDDRSQPRETLTPNEQIEKGVYIDLLKRWVTPDSLGKKSTAEEDMEVFVTKISRTPLEDLKGFFEFDLPLEVREAIQARYRDISP